MDFKWDSPMFQQAVLPGSCFFLYNSYCFPDIYWRKKAYPLSTGDWFYLFWHHNIKEFCPVHLCDKKHHFNFSIPGRPSARLIIFKLSNKAALLLVLVLSELTRVISGCSRGDMGNYVCSRRLCPPAPSHNK